MPNQVQNGKAFEYSIATNYYNYLISQGINVSLIQDAPFLNAKHCYDIQTPSAKSAFDNAALQTIETLLILEPGLKAQSDQNDILEMSIAADAKGKAGDIRDIIFKREQITPKWEVGFSAKNNNDAVKHNRLSMTIDFGKEWLGHSCSNTYFSEIQPIFDMIKNLKNSNPKMKWNNVPDVHKTIYVPVLKAFRKELLRINDEYSDVPKKLLSYLVGRYPSYKFIKDDKHNLVIVKAYNLSGRLNKTVNGVAARAKAGNIKPPTRIIEFEFKKELQTTLIMVLDEGWQISFRIHTADGPITNSLKFDIQFIGNPPVLFTQHLFNID